jgi:uncharacterized protein (TIGR02996 family)
MDVEAELLEALHDQPGDEAAWLALADFLEEQGQADRAELLRLTRALRLGPARAQRQGLERRLQELLAAGAGPCVPTLTNSIGMRLVLIPAGSFRMGSPRKEPGCLDWDGPVHAVALPRPFYLGAFPVTQAEYEQVTGKGPSWFEALGQRAGAVQGLDTHRFPVENVTWAAAGKFCRELSALPAEKEAGRVYRLPTEAEWEYACRASTSSPFHYGPNLTPEMANVQARPATDLNRPTPVGSYPPNAWGLYDLHGNVWEWCQDWFDEDYYRHSPPRDPQGPPRGTERVMRGGAWFNPARTARSGARNCCPPGTRYGNIGFRVAMTVRAP